jgi:hypothetical protein
VFIGQDVFSAFRGIKKILSTPHECAYEVNNAVLAYISDPLVRGRMKHIHKDYHVIKEFVESGYIHPIKIDTSLNAADALLHQSSGDGRLRVLPQSDPPLRLLSLESTCV